jgi:hypothetical protein
LTARNRKILAACNRTAMVSRNWSYGATKRINRLRKTLQENTNK